jgi:hypothetical protein
VGEYTCSVWRIIRCCFTKQKKKKINKQEQRRCRGRRLPTDFACGVYFV